MTGMLTLTIATPSARIIDRSEVQALRAEDGSGSFGILPRHADLLTVLVPSVLRWRLPSGDMRYCAVDSGVLTVRGGFEVAVACRQALPGDDIEALHAKVLAMRAERIEVDRERRVDQTRLHARAVRAMMQLMRGTAPDFSANPKGGDDGIPAE